MGIVVDTGIWVDVERGALSASDVASVTLQDPIFISPVSIAELAFGVEGASTEGIRQKRMAALNRLKKKPCLHIDEETGAIFGSVAARLRKAGRGADFRIQDVWIASQAIQHGYRLLTENERDFRDIPGLDILTIGPGTPAR